MDLQQQQQNEVFVSHLSKATITAYVATKDIGSQWVTGRRARAASSPVWKSVCWVAPTEGGIPSTLHEFSAEKPAGAQDTNRRRVARFRLAP